MCSRFTHRLTWKQINELYRLTGAEPMEFDPRYNLAPRQKAPVIRECPDGLREAVMMRWGLIPAWAGDPSIAYKTINARAETVATAPSYRAAFKTRRCIVPASGFYEWQKTGGPKQPWLIEAIDDAPLSLAGLWERWEKGEQPVETFSIITTTPNELVAPIHDRMPVILAPEDFDAWLKPEPLPAATSLLRPYPADLMKACRISTRVNSPKNDDPAIIEPVQ
ncbi:MAG: SOS response-associated peptidase [Dongiaceae bacterium]